MSAASRKLEPLMTDVTRIDASIQTVDFFNVGTDGDMYLFFGGREFHLDTVHDDFEAGSSRTYVLGEGSNVLPRDAHVNDPRHPQLVLEQALRLPVYLRFAPKDGGDHWALERLVVTVNGGLFPMWDSLGIGTPVQMGRRYGLVVHAPMHTDTPGRPTVQPAFSDA